MRVTNRIPMMCALMAGLIAAGARPAHAQAAPSLEDKTFINVSGGMQVQSRDVTSTNSFPLFDETATVTATPSIGSGFVFDVSVGRQVWSNLVLSLGVSTFHKSTDAPFTASIPNPAFFNQFTTVTGTATDFEQSIVQGNLIVTWIQPVNDKFDVAFFGGPSFLKVTQTIVSVDVVPATGAVTPKTSTESKNSAKAGMVGVDLLYKVNARYGAGFFVRYSGGEADLPSSPNQKVGGTQIGGGLRVRF